MPSVSPIAKSPVTEYLLKNKFHAVKQDNNPLWKHHNLYFYGENEDYLGEMMINQKGYGIEVHKLIFQEKLKPIYREYIRIQNTMRDFWSKENQDKEEFRPISSTTTKVTIDLINKKQTTQVIKRVLGKKPILINEVLEKGGIEVYELDNQPFNYKIESITEETKPYKWGKYSKYNVFV